MSHTIEIGIYAVFLLTTIVLPLGWAIYVLLKRLRRQILDIKQSHPKRPSELSQYSKIAFTIVGILYGLFLLSPVAVLPFRLAGVGFSPPGWLGALYLILYVPYLAIVFGVMGGVEVMGQVGGAAGKMWRSIFSDTSTDPGEKKEKGNV